MSRRAHPSLLAAALLVLLAACRPTATSDGVPGAASTDAPIDYPATDYQAGAPGTPGGTLRVSTALDTGTLDFQTITHTNAKWLGRLLYDNLVYLDEKGRIGPWLATSWDISADGLTYRFHLRDGVTFSDGTPLDAEAVRANLARMRDPATRAAMTTAYIAPYAEGRVIDRLTFEARLSEPYTPFLNVLAQSWLGLMSPKALKEHPKQLGESPVGSGPFTVESYTRQQGIRFVRRKDYDWAPPFLNHRGPAYLDRVEVEFVPEAMLRYTALASGQHDLTVDAPPQNASAIRANPELALASRVNLGNPTRALTFNVSQAPFDDVRVRRALTLATDRDAIARIVGFGEYRPKTDFLSVTTPFYDPSYRGVLVHDVAAAHRLLDEAGWTARDAEGYRTRAGVRLGAEVLTTESQSPSPVLVAVQSDARQIGFDLRIVQMPAGPLTERRNANRYQALGAGFWHTNTPDGLYIVYHSRQITSERYIGQNTSRLTDPALDDLLLQARGASDPMLLRDLYGRAQQRLTDLVPAIPLFENHTLVAWRRQVHGVVFDTSHNTPYLLTAWLAKEPA